MAHDQKKVIARGASLLFTDESGFLLLPLVRRTLAPRGRTPILRHRAKQRDKVSVAAALALSPVRGHASLYYQTYPNLYVNSAAYATFVRRLLWHVHHPLVVVQDQGSLHKGDPLRTLSADFPRLDLNMLPPYAPELNPVEQLWNFEKDKELSNFVPSDVRQLESAICCRMQEVRCDQRRLRSFFAATPLPWDGLTVFF
jgi:putative transposase